MTGETIIGANMFKDLFAGIRDIVGGRTGAYEKGLSEAKDTSMMEMMQRAQALGANAIVGIDIDYETVVTLWLLPLKIPISRVERYSQSFQTTLPVFGNFYGSSDISSDKVIL